MATDELSESLDGSSEGVRDRVALEGEIDLGRFEALDRVLASAASRCEAVLEIDLSEVTFMDSMGIHLLLRTRERLSEKSLRMVVVDPSPTVVHVLEVAGLRDVFEIVDVREA